MRLLWSTDMASIEVSSSGTVQEAWLAAQWIALLPLIAQFDMSSPPQVVQEASAKQIFFLRGLRRSLDDGVLQDVCDDLDIAYQWVFGIEEADVVAQRLTWQESDQLIKRLLASQHQTGSVSATMQPRWKVSRQTADGQQRVQPPTKTSPPLHRGRSGMSDEDIPL